MSCPCRCTNTERLLGRCVLDVVRRSGLTVNTDIQRRQALLSLGLPEDDAEADAGFVRVNGKDLWLIGDKAAILAAVRAARFVVRDGKGGIQS